VQAVTEVVLFHGLLPFARGVIGPPIVRQFAAGVGRRRARGEDCDDDHRVRRRDRIVGQGLAGHTGFRHRAIQRLVDPALHPQVCTTFGGMGTISLSTRS
jgi:hypothetical protein